MEITVSGRQVVLRDRLPAAAMWELTRAAATTSGLPPWPQLVEQLRLFVERWEFEGDPNDPAAYEQLDYYDLIAIYRATNEEFARRMGEQKN